MTRLNRPDSLLTELRDIKRRLHILETAVRVQGNGTLTTLAAAGSSFPPEETSATLRCSQVTDPLDGPVTEDGPVEDPGSSEHPAGEDPNAPVQGP